MTNINKIFVTTILIIVINNHTTKAQNDSLYVDNIIKEFIEELVVPIIDTIEDKRIETAFVISIDPQLKVFELDTNSSYHKILDLRYIAIPSLIKYIDIDLKYMNNLGKRSSLLQDEYFGIVCAKLIEKIIDINFKCHSLERMGKDEILSIDDMFRIKKIYYNWWNINKYKFKCSDKELTTNISRPLEGSGYSWSNCNRIYELEDKLY